MRSMTQWKFSLALVSLLLQAAAQTPVVLHVTVTDKQQNLVTTLGRENFKVFEDGVEQTIQDFQHGDQPASVGIVLDSSSSMRRKLSDIVAAVLSFVRKSNPKDEFFVVNFNHESFLDSEFSSDPDDVKKALVRTDGRGGTALYDALIDSLDHLMGGTNPAKVLLVVTDGIDTSGRSTLAQVFHEVQESGALLYAVGLLYGEKDSVVRQRGRNVLENIAEAGGGAAFFPTGSKEVESIAVRIADEIRNQYSLSYTPAEPGSPGKFRKVRVVAQAPGQDKLVVRTRAGYFTHPLPPAK